MNILFGVFAAISFFGMIGENGKPSQKHYTATFVVSIVAAVATTIF